MLYLLYGDDEFSLGEALAELTAGLSPDELRDVNTTELDGSAIRLSELIARCDTMPFLAERRVVIVRGLLSRFQPRPRPAAGEAPRRAADALPTEWQGLAGYVAHLPDTTVLITVDGRLTDKNPLLRQIAPLGQTRVFSPPAGRDLVQWVQSRVAKAGGQMAPAAASALAASVGSDLRTLHNEVQKLVLYCAGRVIRAEDVGALVTHAREANVFKALDAAMEGRPKEALMRLHDLLEAGQSPAQILTRLARQMRLMILAKEHVANGLPVAEIGARLRLSGYPLRKTLAQEATFTEQKLVQMHHRVLEADLDGKTGAADQRLTLDLLIADIATATGRRPANRRSARG